MDGLIKGTQSGTDATYFHRKCSVDEQSALCVSAAESVLDLTAAASTETAHYLMFNRMVTAPVRVIQSVKGEV